MATLPSPGPPSVFPSVSSSAQTGRIVNGPGQLKLDKNFMAAGVNLISSVNKTDKLEVSPSPASARLPWCPFCFPRLLWIYGVAMKRHHRMALWFPLCDLRVSKIKGIAM